VIPIRWYNRKSGISKLRIKEMGSRYLFIVLYVWLEKHLSKGDYLRGKQIPSPATSPMAVDKSEENGITLRQRVGNR